jgi:hypothetical protein
LGALLISLGILLVSSVRKAAFRASLMLGIAIGVTIACYTIVEADSVTKLMIAPLLVEYAGTSFRALVLSGKAWNQRGTLRAELLHCWFAALPIPGQLHLDISR